MIHNLKVFRIFISSTFSDMVAERNALQEFVYPRLRQLCAKHNSSFQAIDLRWGISAEAGLNQRATEVCLNEIARCQRVTDRPNFLLLMGDRYGWCPAPDDIPADEWNVLFPRLQGDDQTLLKSWYKRDDNAVPPVYVLQPRTGATIDQARWNSVEARLRQALLNGLAGLDWTYEQRLKYEKSVTEQEIAAGILNYHNSRQSAFCFFRTIEGLPPDAVRYRDADPQCQAHLIDLKQRLRNHLPNNIHEYRAVWSGSDLSTDHIKSFCDDVYKVLARAIEAEASTSNSTSPLTIERETHAAFMSDRTQHFVGREDSLGQIHAYLANQVELLTPVAPASESRLKKFLTGHSRPLPQNLPLVVYGASGVGKSTVMARAAEQFAGNKVVRFIGVSPESSDIRRLLISLCHEINEHIGGRQSIPQTYSELAKLFPRLLARVPLNRPLVIFLDALDQLSAGGMADSLRWLPDKLPMSVKLVMSVIPGPFLDALHQRLPENTFDEAFVEIEAMGEAEAEALLEVWLHDAGRKLMPLQKAEVMGKFAITGLPLYLKLAFEEARLWHSYDSVPTLQPDVQLLIHHNLFKRLADKSEHGSLLVERGAAYLRAARHGLSEDEIIEVLTQDQEFWDDFYGKSFHQAALNIVRQVPIAVWSRFYYDLSPYIVERSQDGKTLMGFYHRQFNEAVDALYLKGSKKQQRHTHLAQYFESQPLFADGIANARKLAEQPYQEARAKKADAYITTLSDIAFLTMSLETREIQALIEDCDLLPDPSIHLIGSALGMSAHILQSDRNALAQQLSGRLMRYKADLPIINRLIDAIYQSHTGLLPDLNARHDICEQAGSTLLRTLDHQSSIKGIALMEDGDIVSWSNSSATVRIWSADGELINTIAEVKNEREQISGVLPLPDGMFVAWGSLLDLRDKTGSKLNNWSRFTSAAWRLYNENVLYRENDAKGTLKLWNTKTDQVATLKGHSDYVFSVSQFESGEILTVASDNTARLWDREGRALQVFKHRDIGGAIRLQSGEILTWSKSDFVLRLWDMQGHQLHEFVGHTQAVIQVVELRSGQICSWDGTQVRLWDRQGKTQRVVDLAFRVISPLIDDIYLLDSFNPFGRLTIGVSNEPTLHIWDSHGDQSIPLEESQLRQETLVRSDGSLLGCGVDGIMRFWGMDGKVFKKIQLPFTSAKALELDTGKILVWSPVSSVMHIVDADKPGLDKRQPHSGRVRLLRLNSGGIASWDNLNTVFWSENGQCLSPNRSTAPKTHSLKFDLLRPSSRTLSISGTPAKASINGLLELASGEILSWGSDICITRPPDGLPIYLELPWTSFVQDYHGAIQTRSGQIWAWRRFSGGKKGHEGCIDLWETAESSPKTLSEHSSDVYVVIALENGRVVSYGVHPNRLILWDEKGRKKHSIDIGGRVMLLQSGQILAITPDKFCVLNPDNLRTQHAFDREKFSAAHIQEMSNGQIVSCSAHELSLWDLRRGCIGKTEIPYIEGLETISPIELGILGSNPRRKPGLGIPLSSLLKHTNIYWEFARKYDLNPMDFVAKAPTVGSKGTLRIFRQGRELSVFNTDTLSIVSTFYGDAIWTGLTQAGKDMIAASDDAGRVVFLCWHGNSLVSAISVK